MPTGEFIPVKGTPYDFTESRRIGEQVTRLPDGVDHNFVLFSKVTVLTSHISPWQTDRARLADVPLQAHGNTDLLCSFHQWPHKDSICTKKFVESTQCLVHQ